MEMLGFVFTVGCVIVEVFICGHSLSRERSG